MPNFELHTILVYTEFMPTKPKISTVNISFQTDILREIDRVAHDEARSRSELIREAARMYISRKNHWNKIFSATQKYVHEHGLKKTDVSKAMAQHRRRKTTV